jgi:hypothetical protein
MGNGGSVGEGDKEELLKSRVSLVVEVVMGSEEEETQGERAYAAAFNDSSHSPSCLSSLASEGYPKLCGEYLRRSTC